MGFSQWLQGNNRGSLRQSFSRALHFHPHLEFLEERSLFTCTSMDPFICTPLTSRDTAFEFHPYVSIFINGQQQTIPANIGLNLDKNGTAISFLPIHTRYTSGKLEIDSPNVRDFHLQDFFDTWGQPFDSTHILGYHTTPNNPLRMTVGGQLRTDYGSFQLHDGQDIVITANNAVTNNPPPALSAPLKAVTINPPPASSTPNNAVTVNPAPVLSTPASIFPVSRVPGPNQSASSVVADIASNDSGYPGPVSVSIGHVNNDSTPDVVTGAALGASHLKVFNSPAIANSAFISVNPDAGMLDQFFANDLNSGTGVSVGAADVQSTANADIITGSTTHSANYRVVPANAFEPQAPNGIEGAFGISGAFNIGA